MTDTTTDPAAAARAGLSNSRLLRFAVAVVALIELAFSAPGLQLLAKPETLTALGLPGWIILGAVVLTPLLAITALIFAILGQLRNAVFALGALILTGWVNTAFSAVNFGLNFDDAPAMDNVMIVFLTFVAPLLATFAIVLAGLRYHIALAVVLVSLPTVVNVLSIAVMAAGLTGS